MSQRGRPRLVQSAQQVRVTLCLRPGEDDDLMAFFATIPPGMRAAAVKSALRSGKPFVTSSDQPVVEEEDLEDFLLG